MADDQPLEKRVGLALQIARQEKDIRGNILTTIYEQIEQLRAYKEPWSHKDEVYRAHHTIASFLREMGYGEFDLAHLAKLERVRYERNRSSEGQYDEYLEIDFDGTERYYIADNQEYGEKKAEQQSVVQGTHPIFNTGNYLAKLLKIAVEADAIRDEQGKNQKT